LTNRRINNRLSTNFSEEPMANSELIAKLIGLLETAVSVESDAARPVVYSEALGDLSELQIKHAFKRAVTSWRPEYGRTFPSPAELREYAEELDGPPKPPPVFQQECDPERLPKGWSMQEWKAAQLTLQKARQKPSTPTITLPYDPSRTPQENKKRECQAIVLQSWAEGNWGPNRQKAAGPLLEQIKAGKDVDVPWRIEDMIANAAREKVRSWDDYTADEARKRLVPSTIPADPVERKKWAHDKAVAQGWIPS
jgi:hypothetical protein